MIRTIQNTLHTIWNALAWCLAALVLIGGGLFGAGKVGLILPFSAYVILSGSMEPSIPTGSVIFVQQKNSYAIGDVITFTQKGDKTAVTHRIADVKPVERYFDETYSTKGDANKSADSGSVSQSNVQGKVLLTIPKLGYLVNFAKTPKGFLVFIVIPATIVIYEELRKVKRDITERIRLARMAMKVELGITEKKSWIPDRVGNDNRMMAAVPIVAALFVGVGAAGSYFMDTEHSLANVLGAATSFGEKTSVIYESNPYTCPGGAGLTTTPVGTMVLTADDTLITVDIKVEGLSLTTEYDLWINQDPGACPLAVPTYPDTILTDAGGDAVFQRMTPRVAGAVNAWISLTAGSEVYRSVAVPL